MKTLTTWDKIKYLFRHGQNLFWMRPGVDVEFYWGGTWFRAKIQKEICEIRGVIQVPIHYIDEDFVRKYLALNSTAVSPWKVRKYQWRKKTSVTHANGSG